MNSLEEPINAKNRPMRPIKIEAGMLARVGADCARASSSMPIPSRTRKPSSELSQGAACSRGQEMRKGDAKGTVAESDARSMMPIVIYCV